MEEQNKCDDCGTTEELEELVNPITNEVYGHICFACNDARYQDYIGSFYG